MKAQITVGWSPDIKKLSLIRLLHEIFGYSVAKSEHLVNFLDEDRTHFLGLIRDNEDAAREVAQRIKVAGASCEVILKQG